MATTSIPCVGTELKINVHFEPICDLHMSDYDFECMFYTQSKRKSIIVPKTDMIAVDEDNYLALVDTSLIGGGTLIMDVTAYIPDTDFADGLRTEKARFETSEYISI